MSVVVRHTHTHSRKCRTRLLYLFVNTVCAAGIALFHLSYNIFAYFFFFFRKELFCEERTLAENNIRLLLD